MSISREFFKDDSPVSIGLESNLLLLVDNYSEIINKFRVIKVQHEEVKRKKQDAHRKLQELRESKADLTRSGRKLSEVEKMELQEKEEYLIRQREEDAIIYYNGEPMTHDEVSTFLLDYQNIVERIELLDYKLRYKVAGHVKVATKTLTKPLLSFIRSKIKRTKSTTWKKIFRDIRDLMIVLPDINEQLIIVSTKTNLKDHVPD